MRSADALPEPTRKRAMVISMFDDIASRYDRVNRVISLGRDRAWRRRTVRALRLRPGSLVLDLACGTGDLCDELTAAGLTPVGVDLSAGMLAARRTRAPVVRADVLELPMPDASVDGVTCGFALRSLTDLDAFLAECARVLCPGGRVGALDAGEPDHTVVRFGHDLWFRGAVPWLGARLSGNADAYRYLPASTSYLPPPHELVALVAGAGFDRVERTTMMCGAVQVVTGTRS